MVVLTKMHLYRASNQEASDSRRTCDEKGGDGSKEKKLEREA